MLRYKVFIYLLSALMTGGTAYCVTTKPVLSADQFPISSVVSHQIGFWLKIFSEYQSSQIVIHDTEDPRLIIDIIDLKKLPQLHGLEKLSEDQLKDVITKAYLARYQKAIERLGKYGKKALSYGPMEERILNVYRRYVGSLRRLLKGKVKIRSQSGLADEFQIAAGRAQYYLPFMERVFRAEGVPAEITRLAFVESMFNFKAKSKVGASGIWQFMPDTARYYMHITKLVDERNSPFKATRGAAKLLADNFRQLQSWPLAITAYNHGRAGIAGAVKAVRSKDLGRIIEEYDSASFGYASRNFYAEFIAAVKVYEKLKKAGQIKSTEENHSLVSVTLPQKWSIERILTTLPVSVEILKKFNPCINEFAYKHYSKAFLPKNFEIFLPRELAHKVRYALVMNKNKQIANRE